MGEMFNYIFGNLNDSNNAIKAIKKTLKSQARFNRRNVIFTLGTITCFSLVYKQLSEQNEKIKKLTKQIEETKELNSTKGE